MLINDLDISFGVQMPHDPTRVQTPRASAAIATRVPLESRVPGGFEPRSLYRDGSHRGGLM